MARDQAGLMRELGFGRFQLVGHDRGARVSHRLTLDHPGAVTRLAVLDIVPTRHVLGHVTREMATAYYHWFFLPLRARHPRAHDRRGPGLLDQLHRRPAPREGREHRPGRARGLHPLLQRPGHDRGLVRRLPLGRERLDLVHDEETFASGQRIECPVLVLWGTQGFVGRGYEPLSVWREYATDVRGEALPTGHFIPEEAPDLVIAALREFLD